MKYSCYNCEKEFPKERLIKTEEHGYWCGECMDDTPGDKTGYCSESCCLFGYCDDSC